MRVVSDRGGGGVNAAKMCISVLRPPTSGSDVDGVGSTKRRGAGGGEGGRESLEAVQIAGPEGVFQEWKVILKLPSVVHACYFPVLFMLAVIVRYCSRLSVFSSVVGACCQLSVSEPICWCPRLLFLIPSRNRIEPDSSQHYFR